MLDNQFSDWRIVVIESTPIEGDSFGAKSESILFSQEFEADTIQKAKAKAMRIIKNNEEEIDILPRKPYPSTFWYWSSPRVLRRKIYYTFAEGDIAFHLVSLSCPIGREQHR